MLPADDVRRLLGERGLALATVPARPAQFADQAPPLRPELIERLRSKGLERLYTHQAEAIGAALAGQDVAVVTGTGSGKSLCYTLPSLHACLAEPAARALFLFPTKALAQDQLGKIRDLAPAEIKAATYDGDTPQAQRPSIRGNAHIVLTNPDMLHLAILPQAGVWAKFLKSVRYVVVDEMHAYRGLFGSHMAGVLRRLLRSCAGFHNRPTVIGCTATIANPVELFTTLTGREPLLVDQDGAPRGERTVIVIDPAEEEEGRSPNQDTAALLADLAARGVRSLAFCRARVTTELVARQARERLTKSGGEAGWVDSYRGGYSPDERRAIEGALFSGRLRGLATTNAMELGVDVGGLDAVVMNGYPGSVTSFWQQAGRAGRGARPGLAVMLAHPEPLERYLVRRPELLLDRPVEAATVSLTNRHVLEGQLRCAAYEHPLDEAELETFGPAARSVAEGMVEEGTLAWAEGRLVYGSYEPPAPQVSIRGTMDKTVTLTVAGRPLGLMERWRALRNAHEGAVYLHRGETYLVSALDLVGLEAHLSAADPGYYTEPEVQSYIEATVPIAEDTPWLLTGVRVTTKVVGYRKKALSGDRVISEHDLDLPPDTYESLAVRLDLPGLTGEEGTGTVHTLEHALASVAPLLAGCDRDDLESAWFLFCPETGAPAVYLVDSTPGGVGLAERLFEARDVWWAEAGRLVTSCPCDDGCPACTLSPRCPYGNEPLDKAGAVAVFEGSTLV